MGKLKIPEDHVIQVKEPSNFYLDDRNCSTPRVLQAIRKISAESYEVKRYRIIGDLFLQPFPSSQLGKYKIDLNNVQTLTVHRSSLNKIGFIMTVHGSTVFHTLLHQELRS